MSADEVKARLAMGVAPPSAKGVAIVLSRPLARKAKFILPLRFSV